MIRAIVFDVGETLVDETRAWTAVADAAGITPLTQTVYVGDRLDNDVLPARAAGMRAVFIRRRPWGHIHARWPDASAAHARIASLAELPALLAQPEPVA